MDNICQILTLTPLQVQKVHGTLLITTHKKIGPIMPVAMTPWCPAEYHTHGTWWKSYVNMHAEFPHGSWGRRVPLEELVYYELIIQKQTSNGLFTRAIHLRELLISLPTCKGTTDASLKVRKEFTWYSRTVVCLVLQFPTYKPAETCLLQQLKVWHLHKLPRYLCISHTYRPLLPIDVNYRVITLFSPW